MDGGRSFFRCPVCGGALTGDAAGLHCENGHRFDRARQGYVNLLQSQRASGTRRGDDGEMIRARTAFLEKVYYAPLRRALRQLTEAYHPGGPLLDVGCGEGWYAEALRDSRTLAAVPVLGADISKDAVKAAARRGCYTELAVASASRLPLCDGGCGTVWNVFSPPELAEYRRVLAPGGILLRALPLEEHLFSLKAAVYDRPRKNPPPQMEPAGFRLLEAVDVRERITVSPTEDILALFDMTPYRDKTAPRDRDKLKALDSLEVEFAVRLAAYRKAEER